MKTNNNINTFAKSFITSFCQAYCLGLCYGIAAKKLIKIKEARKTAK